MVECEYSLFPGEEVEVFVLIDTWWNVNILTAYLYAAGDAVLIDTWWNVNQVY